MVRNHQYSENLKNGIRLLSSLLSTEERKALIGLVGFAFEEGKIAGKEELLNDSKDENEMNTNEQKEEI